MAKSIGTAVAIYLLALIMGYLWLQFILWIEVASWLGWLRVFAGPVPALFSHAGYGFFSVFSMVLLIPLFLFAEMRWARIPAISCFGILWVAVGAYVR
jgi:hypothetical protein